jgi:hypothetical protein
MKRLGLVLLSGDLDLATAAGTAHRGQTHQRESVAARAIATPLGLHRRKARYWLMPTPSLPFAMKV